MDKSLTADRLIDANFRLSAKTLPGEAAVAPASLASGAALRLADPARAAAAGASESLSTPPVGGDDIPDDTSSNVTLNVMEGQTVSSSINHPLDQDFFQVQLSANNTYEFTLTPQNTANPGGPDMLIEVYDADGVLVTSVDGGSFGEAEELDFTPEEDGVYYVNIKGFTAVDVGAYSITGKINDDGPDVNFGTPLDAIDWGGTETRVDTDGVKDSEGDDVIQVYFANAGEIYMSDLGPVVATEWADYAIAGVQTAMSEYEKVINVSYDIVDSAAEADFVLIVNATVPVLLGRMSPPGESYEGQGEFNALGVGWTEEGLKQGGYGYVTFIHEFGHGMGLAHPHDTGGGSAVMNGVESDSDAGDFNLNQGVFTTMSYRSGFPDGPQGGSDSDNWGYEGGPMALDIAVLQQKYGANMDYRTGNDVYELFSANQSGTHYACVWDAGGTDKIVAGAAMNVVIQLREATLKYEVGGGGWVSYAEGIHGGYTIANGVVIENADGGAGDDMIVGNAGRNLLGGLDGVDKLRGGAGIDRLMGGSGADTLFGDAGNDRLFGGEGNDVLYGGAGADTFLFKTVGVGGKEIDRLKDIGNSDVIDVSGIDANVATRQVDDAFVLVSAFTNTAGEALLFYDEGPDQTVLLLDNTGDGKADLKLVLDGDHMSFGGWVL